MTVSAGNVAVGWTHDLGGFMGPVMRDPEMFLRWLQFGVYSYLFRTHCSFCEIRIWKYPNFPDLKQTFLLRNSLIPYIYSASYFSYLNSDLLVTPLYFIWPQEELAYKYNSTEYLFGPDLLVAPITNPVNPATNTTQKAIWIPPGNWINWNTGEELMGPQEISPVFGMTEIPVYARAGAIIPMKYPTIHSTLADPLILTIFPSKGSFSLTKVYEDDGETLDYTINANWINQVSVTTENNIIYILYSYLEGLGFVGQIEGRLYEFHLRGLAVSQLEISCNGVPINYNPNHTVPGWWNSSDGQVPIVIIAVGYFPISSLQIAVKVTIQ
jgi:alpha-glucosidase (family GH31 glycosyl hydrolase)